MDKIILPQKFSEITSSILNRKVQRFLLPLDNKKINEAVQKGYTELKIALIEKLPYIHEDKLWVIAEKPGNIQEDDFIKIKELPAGRTIPIAMSINEAKYHYERIYSNFAPFMVYPKTILDQAKEVVENGYLDRLSRNPDKITSCPTSWLPYTIIIRKLRFRKVQDYDWEGLQMEGMTMTTISQEEYNQYPKVWKKNTNENRQYFSLEWTEEYKDCNYSPDKDELYKRFVRSVYGQKVWDNNEIVVEFTVYSGLNSYFFYNTEVFLKYCEALLPENEVEQFRERFSKTQ